MSNLVSTPLSPKVIRVGNEILAWAREYLTTEHKEIRRPAGDQTVCPFVAASLENDSFYLAFHPEVFGQSEAQIEELLLQYITVFGRMGPFDTTDKYKKALLVVFPNIPESESRVLDIAHNRIKPIFVSQGLMIGQFHPNCAEKAFYNPTFKVSVAPYCLMAIRYMAPHDILFLGSNPDWFKEYAIRFGERFREPTKLEDFEKPLLKLYTEARSRFAGS